MAGEITLTFTPTARDYGTTRAFMNRHLIGRWRWGHLIISPLLASLITGGVVILVALGDLYAPPMRQIFVFYGLLAIVIGLSLTLCYLVLLRAWLSRRIFHPGGYLLEPRRMTFTPDGLTNHGSIANTSVTWSKTNNILEDKGYIYFLLDRAFAIFLPKRVFKTHEELEEFLKTVTEWRDKAFQ